jgi:hypothetical protein
VEVEMIATTRLASTTFCVLVLLAACHGSAGSGDPANVSASAPSPSPSEPGASPSAPASPSTPGAPSDPGAAPEPDTGPPAVQLIGRFDERDSAGPKAGWPGVRILARFDGTGVSVRLGEEIGNAGPSEWDVAIDDEWRPASIVLAAGPHDYTLAANLPRGKHKVELYKRTEGQNGVTQFLGYDFHGGALLAPPVRLARRLEIIGDSDVAGFGYKGAITGSCLPGPAWAASLEDFRQAWGQRLATSLDAELDATVFSGKGFYFNIWRPDTETIGVLYPRSNPVDAQSVFDMTRFTPDVVVVSLGGNDYNLGLPDDTGPAPLGGFTQKVRELTTTLRGLYPRAHIFLMAYAVLTDEYPPGRLRRTNVVTGLEQVTQERSAAGDARVHFVAPPPSTEAELTGCDGHGGPAYHARIASYMSAQIKAATGWK